MPTEIKKIQVTAEPQALRAEPELAAHIGIISSFWAEVEERLALLFAFAMRTEPAVSATALGEVFSVPTKLNMIRSVLKLRVSKNLITAFDDLAKNLKKRAKERNRIVHGLWTTHPKHPRSLLRMAGVTDPELKVEKYVLRDFVEIEMRLVRQIVDLVEFSQLAASAPKLKGTTKKALFWQPTGPTQAEAAPADRQSRPASQGRKQSKPPRQKRG